MITGLEIKEVIQLLNEVCEVKQDSSTWTPGLDTPASDQAFSRFIVPLKQKRFERCGEGGEGAEDGLFKDCTLPVLSVCQLAEAQVVMTSNMSCSNISAIMVLLMETQCHYDLL